MKSWNRCAFGFIFLCIIIFQISNSWATDLIDINAKGTAPASDASMAHNLIIHQVIADTAAKYILNTIGRDKFVQNKNLVKKVMDQADKFIPFIETHHLQKTSQGFTMDVHLRLSPRDLRALLMRYGLLSKGKGQGEALVVLPMVEFDDAAHSVKYKWWIDSSDSGKNPLLQQLSADFESSVSNQFEEKGFFTVEPNKNNLSDLLPSALRFESPRLQDLTGVAQFFDAQLVIFGQVDLAPDPNVDHGWDLAFRISAYDMGGDARPLGEIDRVDKIAPNASAFILNQEVKKDFADVGKDMASQVRESWQNGVLGFQVLRVGIIGSPTFQQLENFKSWFDNNINDAKDLRERLFEPGEVIFDVDTLDSSQALAGVIQKTAAHPIPFRVQQVSASEVDLALVKR